MSEEQKKYDLILERYKTESEDFNRAYEEVVKYRSQTELNHLEAMKLEIIAHSAGTIFSLMTDLFTLSQDKTEFNLQNPEISEMIEKIEQIHQIEKRFA